MNGAKLSLLTAIFIATAFTQAEASTNADYSAALQTNFAKGTLGSPGKTRPIEMFFQNVSKSGNSYSVSGKSKTSAAEDAFSGTLSISSAAAGGSCSGGETEIKGSYDLNEKESKTSGSFKGTFTACEKGGKLSKASFKGNWVKHANGNKTPCDFGLYKTVKIGNQTWMVEDLYGNWETAMKICPKGWHLSSDAEWETLVTFAGGKSVAGKKLKSKSGWDECYPIQGDDGEYCPPKKSNGTDEYGFSATPSTADCDDDEGSRGGGSGSWWTSTRAGLWIIDEGDEASRGGEGPHCKLQVRCVKD